VTSIGWSQHTRVSPPAFTTVPVDLAILRYIPNAVGVIAYGFYASPEYRVPGEHIPAVGTLTETPPAQGYNELYFTLFLPSGPRPAAGWPVAIVGSGGDQHFATGAVAAMMASHGIATIGMNAAGNGFGPLGTLAIKLSAGSSLVVPDAGRGIDQDGDNVIGLTEGASAAAPRLWTIGVRDGNRQNAIDLLQLVRVIEVGMDVNGDGSSDLDPNRIVWCDLLGSRAQHLRCRGGSPERPVPGAWAMGSRPPSQLLRSATARSTAVAAQRSRYHDDRWGSDQSASL
jgi:hypothetical protein